MDSLNNKHIVVIGDIMLDEYISGECNRISPESPVPVVNVEKRKYVLGGAANVANNIQALGLKVTLVGVIGNDDNGVILKKTLNSSGIKFNGLSSSNRPTTTKTRVTVGGHQLLRYDLEETADLKRDDENDLILSCLQEIKRANVVVISDYKKGVCTENLCRAVIESVVVPVIVDPKQDDWTRYSGAYLITPNLKEFNSSCPGILNSDMHSKAKMLSLKYKIENILITRSQDGMSLFGETKQTDFKSAGKEVFDVSGAGDTVIGTIAVHLSKGCNLVDSVKISNIAAGIAVSKSGTSTVSCAELNKEVNKNENSKIKSVSELAYYVKELKTKDQKIVFTNGCFDILHIGHIALLRQAKQFGDVLIVGLNSDSSVKRLKGKNRPINNERERALLLSALDVVDAVVLFSDDTPIELIKSILPDVLVKGADYTVETVVGGDLVLANGGKVELIGLVDGKSTTATIEKMKGDSV
jgi:D-beta-D-heptose 7-phosphate kinase/D-beta-D-heptose 1-phosphate adenosyltransferase